MTTKATSKLLAAMTIFYACGVGNEGHVMCGIEKLLDELSKTVIVLVVIFWSLVFILGGT